MMGGQLRFRQPALYGEAGLAKRIGEAGHVAAQYLGRACHPATGCLDGPGRSPKVKRQGDGGAVGPGAEPDLVEQRPVLPVGPPAVVAAVGFEPFVLTGGGVWHCGL